MIESQAEHGSRVEPDRISSRWLVAVGVGALLVFLVASLVTVEGLRIQRSEIWSGGPPATPVVREEKIGIVEQKPFETARTGEEWRDEQMHRLESWGWVDRKAGVAHMPIERAMESVVRGDRP
jgi:hypothetical protein